MDGDNFSRATRLGRNAACAVLDAARGAPFDPFSAERLLDALIERAGGIPSLQVMLIGLADYRSPTLLIVTLSVQEELTASSTGSDISLRVLP
jgi:hypothetical protein